ERLHPGARREAGRPAEAGRRSSGRPRGDDARQRRPKAGPRAPAAEAAQRPRSHQVPVRGVQGDRPADPVAVRRVLVWGGLPCPPPRPRLAITLLAALALAPLAAAQPIEPLQYTRPEPPAAPSDVAEAPAKAEKSASGLAWKVLAKGRGDAHPGAHDKV